MLSARTDKGSSFPYSLDEQEAQSLFSRHFPFVPIPYQLETKLTSQVLIAVRAEYHNTPLQRLKVIIATSFAWIFRASALFSLMAVTLLLIITMFTTLFLSTYSW